MYLIRGKLVAQVALCHLFEINKNYVFDVCEVEEI